MNLKPQNWLILIGAAAAIVIVVAVVVIGGGRSSPPQTSPPISQPPTIQPPSGVATPPAQVAGTVVQVTATGFSPASVTVKSGGQMTFQNTSGSIVQVQSAKHPVHADNPELNVGSITPGQLATVTLTTKGNWKFHNHLNPSQVGSVTVE